MQGVQSTEVIRATKLSMSSEEKDIVRKGHSVIGVEREEDECCMVMECVSRK